MSSGYVSPDGKKIGFEINHNNIQGNFSLSLIPSSLNLTGTSEQEERICMRLYTQSIRFPDSMECTNSVVITKSYSKVLAHMFRQMADKMDEWYAEPDSTK